MEMGAIWALASEEADLMIEVYSEEQLVLEGYPGVDKWRQTAMKKCKKRFLRKNAGRNPGRLWLQEIIDAL